MAFGAISSLLIQVGKPVVKTLWDLVQGNFDDHESRIAGVEQGATKIKIWNGLVKTRSTSPSLTGISIYRSEVDQQLIEARLAIFEIGSATGILEFDIVKSSTLDFSSAVSIFTTRPSIDLSSASDFDQSVNGVFDINEQDLDKNDRLKLNITSLPIGLSKFEIFLLGELI